jgi:4-aminobutyrate aminotransferase-like enzyme
MLYKWLEINPIGAENIFRKTVGLPIKKVKTIDKKIQRRLQHISPILSLSYKQPISIARSAFQYMYDDYGNTFLDAYNNIPQVGHSHPKVVVAGQRQMARLNTNTRYLYDLLPTYAEKLLSKFPKSLNKVYFVNSGSAASDLAMRMAYTHTNHKKIMVMEHGYHGNTQISMDISDYKFSNTKGSGQKDYILKTPIPDTYRGQHKNNDGSAGKLYAQEAIASIEQSQLPIAAFICEPIVGCGGQVPLAKGYLKELYPAIRKQDGLCISDEVQTGFGRLGDHFWGFESQEVVPDMVIIGKPMANGHPMGAVITTSDIADSFNKGVEFFSSFGGNPVSCAIGLSVLQVIEEEHLQENAKIVGDFYKSLFIELQTKYACIGDVRGSGLFIGVEIVKENTLNPDQELASIIKNELRNRNILISTDGPYESVLKTKPPLCFTKENAQRVVQNIEGVLKVYFNKT